MKEMTIQDHVDKVHLVLNNTEQHYDRKIAIFRVYEKSNQIERFLVTLQGFAADMVNATNLVESNDPFMSGVLAARVAGLVYVDLLTEYQEGEWK